MAKLRTAYIIEMGWGGQPTDVTEIKISKKDYESIEKTPRNKKMLYNGREIYGITTSYIEALYTVQN